MKLIQIRTLDGGRAGFYGSYYNYEFTISEYDKNREKLNFNRRITPFFVKKEEVKIILNEIKK